MLRPGLALGRRVPGSFAGLRPAAWRLQPKRAKSRAKDNFYVKKWLTFNRWLLISRYTSYVRGVASMLVIIDERDIVTSGYTSGFCSEGVASAGFRPVDFREWVTTAPDADLIAVEAFLLGDCRERQLYPKLIKERSRAPLIAMSETPSLEQTLDLFAAGVDDVVRKPVHVREILARVGAIQRRAAPVKEQAAVVGEMKIFFDGRDPEIKGETFPLPRRERRILEHLVVNRGKRVTKAQIFNAIYGLFDEQV